MTYFCFIESDVRSVPHMEPLCALTPEQAFEEAARLLARHSSGVSAHVFLGERRIHSIRAEELAA